MILIGCTSIYLCCIQISSPTHRIRGKQWDVLWLNAQQLLVRIRMWNLVEIRWVASEMKLGEERRNVHNMNSF